MFQIQEISNWRYGPDASRLDSAPGVLSAYSRWSYRLGPARVRLRCRSLTEGAELCSADGVLRRWDDPLQALSWLETMVDMPASPGGAPFLAGWFGFFGYECGRLFETLPGKTADTSVPLFELFFHDSVDARDGSGPIRAIDLVESPFGLLPECRTDRTSRSDSGTSNDLESNFSSDRYRAAVARAIEYVAAGDIFQVNLSQRLSVPIGRRTPREMYARLTDGFPAWYGAYLWSDDYALLSNSPELLVRVEPSASGRRIITRPIKGTRRVAEGSARDLMNSVKDAAELNMIVDLERNDLGRICRTGTVAVTQPRTIETHSTVRHGVATIEGVLRDEVGVVDLLRAIFPGGSVTGAPKIRAIQIIDELETVPRGAYCGAIGFIGVGGHIELNVAIRTMTFTDGRIYLPVGGGIVADSDPAAEYEETWVKAWAMLDVLDLKRKE